jgi:Glycosyl transferase family 2
MKLVAVCRVRNEVDIIEAFVRHHCAHFHKLIILDDGSSDETLQMLRLLQGEGLPLVVLFEQAIAYEQSHYMTLLLRMAVDQFGADWVAPLDADEFIEPPEGTTLVDALASRERQLLSLSWSNFVWTPESANDPEPNPVLRLRTRLPPRSDCTKLLVPASLVHGSIQLAQGNHELLRDEWPFPRCRWTLSGSAIFRSGIPCNMPARLRSDI